MTISGTRLQATLPAFATANRVAFRHDVLSGRPMYAFMHKLTIWFDGSCPLCVREIRMMRRLDRRGAIEFIDVAAPDVTDCPVDRAELLARLHARENGVLLSGAAAFAAMWRAIPLLRPIGYIARVPLVLSLLERGYILFLGIRPRLQRLARSWSAA